MDSSYSVLSIFLGCVVALLAVLIVGAEYARVDAQSSQQSSLRASRSESIGVVTRSINAVTAQSYYGTERSLTVNELVYQGDVIATGPNAELVFVLKDDTNIILSSNSKITLDKMVFDRYTGRGDMVSRLIRGSVLFVSGVIAKSDINEMSFRTNAATISVRGTKGFLSVSEDGNVAQFWLLQPESNQETAIVVRNSSGTVVLSKPGTYTNVVVGKVPQSPVAGDTSIVSRHFKLVPNAATNKVAQKSRGEDIGFIEAMWLLLKQRLQ